MNVFHEELRPLVGVKKACYLLGRVRSTYYRVKKPAVAKEPIPRLSPPNALSETERARVLALLCEDLHVDSSVAQVYAETLDEGTYLCSQSTMLRILRATRATKDRRRQRTHSAKKRPELLATTANEIWSWDKPLWLSQLAKRPNRLIQLRLLKAVTCIVRFFRTSRFSSWIDCFRFSYHQPHGRFGELTTLSN